MLMEHLTLWRSIPPRSRLEASPPLLEALSHCQNVDEDEDDGGWGEKAVDAIVRSGGNRIRFRDDFTLSPH